MSKRTNYVQAGPAVLSFLQEAELGTVGGAPSVSSHKSFFDPKLPLWEALSESAHLGLFHHQTTLLSLFHIHRYAADLSDLASTGAKELETETLHGSPATLRTSPALALFGKLPALFDLEQGKEGKEGKRVRWNGYNKVPNTKNLTTFEVLAKIDPTFDPEKIRIRDLLRIIMLNCKYGVREPDMAHFHSDHVVIVRACGTWRAADKPRARHHESLRSKSRK